MHDSRTVSIFLASLALAMCSNICVAQTTIYESSDRAGPVFSDQPSFNDSANPTAKKIRIEPMNGWQDAPATGAPANPAAAASYSSLAIVEPANEGTIHTNTGDFDLIVSSAPGLRNGDRIRVKLDGNLLNGSYNSVSIPVTADDWQAAAKPDDVKHTVQAAIVAPDGTPLIESAPVTFYAHRAVVRRQQR